MKKVYVLGLLLFSFYAVVSSAEETFYSDQVVTYSSEALDDPELDAIAVVCIAKDMHLRMGTFNTMHSERIAMETLRVLPVYVVDTIYSKNPLPEIIYIWDETMYWHENPNEVPLPYSELDPYPDQPVIRMVYLKVENLIECKINARGRQRDFETHYKQKQSEGASLYEALSFIDMEDVITTNNVFSLLDWNSVVPVEGEPPKLPPVEPRQKLILSDHMIKQTDEANIYKVPKAFTDDVRTLIDRLQKKSKTLSVNDEELLFKSEMGWKLSDKIKDEKEKTTESK